MDRSRRLKENLARASSSNGARRLVVGVFCVMNDDERDLWSSGRGWGIM